MNIIHQLLGNEFGDNATIVQGDFNGTFSTGIFPCESRRHSAWLIILAGLLNEDRLFLKKKKKITKTDPFYNKKRILELKGPFLYRAFEWILDHEGFQRWRNIKESGAL